MSKEKKWTYTFARGELGAFRSLTSLSSGCNGFPLNADVPGVMVVGLLWVLWRVIKPLITAYCAHIFFLTFFFKEKIII